MRELREVVLCDVCGSPAETWRIIAPDGEERVLDQCGVHSRPLSKLYGEAAVSHERVEVGRPQQHQRQHQVVVIDP